MIDTKELSQALGAVQPGEVAELIDRLEEVEKERDDLRAELTDLRSSMTFRTSLIGRIEAERDALQAKIEAMERPGAAIRSIYGAQPAPSNPEIWLPIPEKHPTFDLVDLRLADGSVLCECVPQSDGDYWWNGPSGEVFIDPKYAPATHWRLAAAPEAKP